MAIWDLQEDLDKINLELELENEMSLACERMERYEAFDSAESYGEVYLKGYTDGFWQGRDLLLRCLKNRFGSVFQKYEDVLLSSLCEDT